MANPFEDENATYIVLRNDEWQYSLWPTFLDIPAGWQVVLPAADRRQCMEFIETNWTDMRPRSLQILDGPSNGAR